MKTYCGIIILGLFLIACSKEKYSDDMGNNSAKKVITNADQYLGIYKVKCDDIFDAEIKVIKDKEGKYYLYKLGRDPDMESDALPAQMYLDASGNFTLENIWYGIYGETFNGSGSINGTYIDYSFEYGSSTYPTTCDCKGNREYSLSH